MTSWTILLIFGALICLVKLLQWLAADHPSVRVAFEHLGPRTDTRYMTRADLFRSSRAFFVWGVVVTAVWIAIAYLLVLIAGKEAWNHPAVPVIYFVFPLLAGCGYLGALWLLIRGLLRREDYDPVAVYQRDTATRE